MKIINIIQEIKLFNNYYINKSIFKRCFDNNAKQLCDLFDLSTKR